MSMFIMVLDVVKGMAGVNGKVLPGCFKYLWYHDEPHTPSDYF